MRDPGTCEAEVALRVETPTAADLDHRVAIYGGTRVEAVTVSGPGVDAGAPQPRGVATESLVIRLPAGVSTYTIAYRVVQAAEWRFRCPVWLPAAAMAGGSRQVRLRVELPAGASAIGGGLPRLAWSGAGGDATLPELPAIVRTPFAPAGQSLAWTDSLDITRVMDAAAVLALVGLTAVWIRRRGR